MQIAEQVQGIIERFKTQELEIVKGYRFNQYRNVQRINLYLNQRFLDKYDICCTSWTGSFTNYTIWYIKEYWPWY